MKIFKIFTIFTLLTTISFGQELKEKNNISYSLGYLFGKNLLESGVTLNTKNINEGINDALSNKESKINDNDLKNYLSQYNQESEKIRQEQNKQHAIMNKKISDDFLEKNKNEPGIIQTNSGLQYIALYNEKGPKPKATDSVTVHYRGTFLDGNEFDSSYKRNEPATFPLNRVIKGWTEGLQLMNVGSKYKFFIPPHLGYGEVPPSGSNIEPNSLLIFEVELLAIEE